MEPLKIMIAEDNSLAAIGLRSQLSNLGHQVVAEARDGIEAIEMTKKHKPDMAILDIKMPRLDGIEACHAIMAHSPIPIILLTAYYDRETIMRAGQAGIMAYLVKPVSEKDLAPAIEVAWNQFHEMASYEYKEAAREEQKKKQETTAEPLSPALPEPPSEIVRMTTWLHDNPTAREILFFFRDRGVAWWQETDIAGSISPDVKDDEFRQSLDRLMDAGFLKTMRIQGHSFYNLADDPDRQRQLQDFFGWCRAVNEKLETLHKMIGYNPTYDKS